MTTLVGRGVRVEIGKTEGTPVAVTAVTLADPGVATATGHSLSAKSVGYFDGVTGMVNLDGQAVRLGTTDTNTFALEDVDTTDYPAFTAGNFVPVTAWSTLSRATNYSIGGGEGDRLDDTTLIDNIRQELQGLLAAQTVTIGLNAETVSSESLALVKRAARNQDFLVFRITLKDGSTRVFRGQPSLPGEDVQQGQIGTGSISVTVKGFVTEGAA